METINVQSTNEPSDKRGRGGRALAGLILVGVGVVWLMHRMNFVLFPSWLFDWPVWLIALGCFIGARRRFQGGGWIVLILIGGVFLVPRLYEYYTGNSMSEYTFPLLFILIGIYMFTTKRPNFRNRGRWSRSHWKKYGDWSPQNNPLSAGNESPEDYIEETSIFGGSEQVIVSKNFKGGDVVSIFGGSDINLSQADFRGTVTLDFIQIFAGADLTVPADWKIVVKSTSIFGGVEDKRSPTLVKENPEKTLIIDGTSIFGGINIQCL